MNNDEIFMNKIINHNCEGLCNERFCSEKETHFFIKRLNGIEIVIPLCEEHAKIYEDYILKKRGCGNE